jgi:hypothetical protein
MLNRTAATCSACLPLPARVENIGQADALLFGRVTYEMMEAAWRLATRTVVMPDWTEPFARTIGGGGDAV